MNLALILFFGGVVIIIWIVAWTRIQRHSEPEVDLSQFTKNLPVAGKGDAVLVAQEHGKLLYANSPARQWLDMNGGIPHLEQIAHAVEPSESFLELFAAETQSSFQLGSRWVEASSHQIPVGTQTRTVVVMRELAANTRNPGALNMSAAMALINEIGETINAGMGVEQTLQTLLTMLSKKITFDAAEIDLWNESEQVLYQRGWLGDTRYLLEMTAAGGKYDLDEGVSGWVARHQKPLLLNSRRELVALQPKMLDIPFESFIAVPLRLGDRFIGTLEVAGLQPDAFKQADLALIQAVSKQFAVTIYNAEIYAEQMRRVDDLASLQQVVSNPEIAHNNVHQFYGALNERIASLLSATMSGIFIYEPDRMGLIAQPPFHGLPEALVRPLFIPLPEDSPQRDIWERQPYWISNDVVDEPLVEALGLRPIVNVAGITNTAWLPLQISDRRIGVLAVSNKQTEGGFTPRDIQHLVVLAAQATIVIENLRLYQRERRMDTELIGLQELTNAIGALSHETEFFSEITERIAHLMEISMVGVLLYDADSTQLRAQLPFFGVENEKVRDYTIDLVPGTVMQQLWEEESYWYSNRVQSDALVYEAGLDTLAETLGVEKTLMATLNVSGRRIGVVQISNKLNGEDFTDSDARLLMVFATQAAAIIENARLYREAQTSAEQAQGLRRVAELAGNVLTTQETFAPVLSEIGNLLDSEIVFVNVLNQQTGTLVTYPRWIHGVEIAEPIVQDIYTPGFEHSVAVASQPFMSNNVLNAPRVLESYRDIAKRFGIVKAIIVPLVFGDRTLGELGVANRHQGNYAEADLEVMKVVAAQTSAALDRLLLYEETGQNLTRRLEELDAISRISNELTITLDLDQVLNVIREEAVKATRASDSTIVLLRPRDSWKYPDVPQMSRRLGDIRQMPDLADIEVEAISRGADTVLITDYDFSTLQASPEGVRSAIAAAVLYLDQVVGVLHLYHPEPNHFDERASTFLMTLAVKASLAYGNSVRYQEQIERSERLRRRVEQLNRIFELGHMFQAGADSTSILEAIAYSVQQSVGYDTVVMTLVDEEAQVVRRIAQAGMPLDRFETSRDDVISMDEVQDLLKDRYRISESYFFPVEDVGQWYVQNISAFSTNFEGNRTVEFGSTNAWRDGDMLLVQLLGASGNLIGLMSLDRPYDNRRPDRSVIEVLEIFSHQAATTIENTRLYLSSVDSAEQEAQINEVMEAVSSTLELSEIVRAVGYGIRRLVEVDRMDVVLTNLGGDTYDLLRVTMDDDNLEISQERRPTIANTALQQAFSESADYLYTSESPEASVFDDLRSWFEEGQQVGIVMPLMTGGENLGAVHIGSKVSTLKNFQKNRPLLNRISQLVATSIQNARLFNQAVDLQVLNRSVVESIQQGIVVLDQSGRIISANEFMTYRYGWGGRNDFVGQDLFTYRPILAEIMAETLRDVLEQGEPQEHLKQTVAISSGEMLISNFYLYPLRSGNVVRGAVILVEDVTERSALEQQMEARANQLGALTEVSTRITSSLERDEVVQLALEEMGWLIPHDTLSLWRRNGSYMVLEGAIGQTDELDVNSDVRFLFSEYELTQQVVETQRVVAVGSRDQLPSTLSIHRNPESWMGVPLVNQGHVVGMMMMTSNTPDAFESKSDQNIAFAFASQVAIAQANADLFEQTFDRTNELGTLLEAANATALSTDLDSVFRTVVELMFSALDMDDCAIMIYDEVDSELEVQVDMNRYGNPDRITPKGTRYDLAQYPAKARALRDREVVVITRDDEDGPYAAELEELRQTGDAARMLVPLVVRENAIGLIQLEQIEEDEVITQQKVRIARSLGTQVAIAIENARLSAQTTAQFEESLIINDLSRAISSTLNLDDMINVVADQVPNVTSASELYLALYESNRQRITFPLAVANGVRFEIPPRQYGDDEVSFIIKQRRPLALGADYFSPEELRRSLGIVNAEGDVKSYLGVPLIAGDEVYGVLAIRDRERTRAFTVNEQRILTTVGSQLGAAIQNARLFERINSFADDLNRQVRERTFELEEERDRIDTLYQITSELARTLDMERLMPRALGMVAKAVSAQDGVIMQLDPVTDQLYSRAVLNPNSLQENPHGDHAIHPAERLARWLIEEDESVVLVEDLHAEEYWDVDAPGASEWHSALAVLLETNEELLGVMVLLSREVNAFVESHLRLMVAAANQVASSINNAELYKLIRDQAERLGSLLRAEQEEAEKNKAILESIGDGVLLADAEGNIILFNTAAERILRVPRDQAMGQSFSNLTGIYGDQAARWAQTLEHRFTDIEDETFGEFINDRVELGDRIVDVQLSPVFTGDKFLGTVSVFRDVTQEVQAARSKTKFIENVSHEFRTPLTPIKGFIDMMLIGATGQITDQQHQILGTVKNNVDRLALLVNDVLKISQIDSGQVQLKLGIVDVQNLIEDRIAHIRTSSRHQNKDLTIETNVDPSIPEIQADEEKIIQIINNLVDNAFKYTPEGGTIWVEAHEDVAKNEVVISVGDNGVGIPKDFQEKIFQRFERHDDSALMQEAFGTGLGLAIVKEMVDMHSGRIWFESTEGEGTVFTFALPIKHGEFAASGLVQMPSTNGSD